MSDPLKNTRRFYDQILRCSNCGFCQAVCPVYGALKRPALNARGKMIVLQEVLEGRQGLTEELVETLFQCTTCASCSTNCPSGVEVPEIIKAVRKDMVNLGTCHPAFTGMNQVLDTQTNIYAEEDVPDFDRELGKKAEVVFFIGCVGRFREEDAVEASLDLLDYLKVDYTLIEEVCCAGVLEDVGLQHQAASGREEHRAHQGHRRAHPDNRLPLLLPHLHPQGYIRAPARRRHQDRALQPVSGRAGHRGHHRQGGHLPRSLRSGPPHRHLRGAAQAP